MVYWTDVEEAARYYVHLWISTGYGDKIKQIELEVVEVERTKKYYTFTNLANIINDDYGNPKSHYYYCFVEAEDSKGNIIEKSNQIGCNVAEWHAGRDNSVII